MATDRAKWFNVEKACGFIAQDGGADVFFDFSTINSKGHRSELNTTDQSAYPIEEPALSR